MPRQKAKEEETIQRTASTEQKPRPTRPVCRPARLAIQEYPKAGVSNASFNTIFIHDTIDFPHSQFEGRALHPFHDAHHRWFALSLDDLFEPIGLVDAI